MRFVVGLGNPGPKYAKTRHNFGFLCLDALSTLLKKRGARLAQEVTAPKLGYWHRWELENEDQVILLWPLTYMNLSGHALTALMTSFPLEASKILLVIDDMTLPLGQLRLRRKGSSGGHNGLKSIEACLGHQEYPRLRLGIDSPQQDQEVIDYVLAPFSEQELGVVEEVVEFSAGQIFDWMQGVSLEALMGKVNGWRGIKEVK